MKRLVTRQLTSDQDAQMISYRGIDWAVFAPGLRDLCVHSSSRLPNMFWASFYTRQNRACRTEYTDSPKWSDTIWCHGSLAEMASSPLALLDSSFRRCTSRWHGYNTFDDGDDEDTQGPLRHDAGD